AFKKLLSIHMFSTVPRMLIYSTPHPLSLVGKKLTVVVRLMEFISKPCSAGLYLLENLVDRPNLQVTHG
ncbi:MAG: hypothetical protein KDK05_05005, partial [Candidatus Competibacteraceae bacterium]|nr:hypothetical protein [Candidatus Competibacteraceae bacterium]